MHKSRRAEYRQKFKDWSASLNHYYNKKGLKVSGHMLIKAMRDSRLTADKIPSARFADAWLSRSVYKQIFRPVRKVKPISSMIAYRPNQLMQADTMFVLRKEAEGIDAIYMLPKAKQQLALQGIKAGEATALVTCIDTLTRRGYAWPVKRPGSAVETRGILEKIFKQAEAWAAGRGFKKAQVKRIQTDSGSEFLGKDDTNRTQGWLAQQKITQSFSFSGKSAAQGMVESFNKTLKYILRLLMKQNRDGTVRWNGWTDKLSTALRIYNARYHSTIKTSPDKVSSNPLSKHYYEKIIDRLKERRNKAKPFTKPSMKVGDYVRVINYNNTKDKNKSNWSFKGGPLQQFAKTNIKKYRSPELWAGLYQIHSVRGEKAGRATTYGVWGEWYVQKQGASGGSRVIKQGLFKDKSYTARASLRQFTAEEIQPIPVEQHNGFKYPDIIQDVEYNSTTGVADKSVTRPRVQKAEEKSKPVAKKQKKKKKVEEEYEVEKFICKPTAGTFRVKWKGYEETNVETVKAMKKQLSADVYRELSRGVRAC